MRTIRTFEEYQLLAVRTEKELPTPERLQHHFLGLQTEHGELADVIKKHHIYGKPFDLPHFREESGDFLWYFAGVCSTHNWNMDELMVPAINTSIPHFPLSPAINNLAFAVGCLVAVSHVADGDGQTKVRLGAVAMAFANLYRTVYADGHPPSSICGERILEDCHNNILKLKVRYPDRYTDVDALARADKIGERYEDGTPL